MQERLEFYNFKLNLKMGLRTAFEEGGDTESQEYHANEEEVERTNSELRDLQLYMGGAKQEVGSAQNHYQRLVTENEKIVNELEFFDTNKALLVRLATQEALWNTKQNTKRDYELQIQTLSDLKWELAGTTYEVQMLAAIDVKIGELEDDIVVAEADIESAQDALNVIAEEQLAITQQREIDQIEAAKAEALINARSAY
jgi:hypothetical protein